MVRWDESGGFQRGDVLPDVLPDRACYCGRPVILAAFFPRETRSNVVRVAATQEDSCPNDRGPVDGLGQWVPVGGELCR